MKTRAFNWPIWSGFLLTLIAFLGYPFFFVRFPITRDFPWANLLLFALAAALLLVGLRRSFALDATRWTRIAGMIAATLSVLVFGFFIFTFFIASRQMPGSHGAPHVGQSAPDFQLADTNGRLVSLSELLSTPVAGTPPKGVLLIFYRGYW